MSQAQLPPVVYVPTTGTPDDAGEVSLELVRGNDGRLALFAYSALDRLEAFYSESAPWALLTVADLQRAYDSVPFDLLFLDRRPRPPEQDQDPEPGVSS
jgi:hypothetical protein